MLQRRDVSVLTNSRLLEVGENGQVARTPLLFIPRPWRFTAHSVHAQPICGIDPGFHTDIAAEVLTVDDDGSRVARYFRWTGKAIESFAKRQRGRFRTKPGDAKPTRARAVAKFRRREFARKELLKGARQLIDLSGVSGSQFMTAPPERLLIAIGRDSCHPGRKRGVHRVVYSGPFIRTLQELARFLRKPIDFALVDEFCSSKYCPTADCLDPATGTRSE